TKACVDRQRRHDSRYRLRRGQDHSQNGCPCHERQGFRGRLLGNKCRFVPADERGGDQDGGRRDSPPFGFPPPRPPPDSCSPTCPSPTRCLLSPPLSKLTSTGPTYRRICAKSYAS